MKRVSISSRRRQRVVGNYLKDKAARLFNSFVAVVCLVMAQNGMAWHFQGVVWYDANQDGIHQSGETGVPGVSVKVLNCTNDAMVFSTVTASDGSFTVTDSQIPLNGNYQVCFTNLPSGYGFTKQIYPPPTNGTIVSTANPVTGCAPCFVFNQLANNTLNNAGLIPVAAQTGFCKAVLTKGAITLSGGMTIDSFNSQDPNFSSNGRYDPNKREDGGDIASDSNLQPAISTPITSSGGADVYGHAGTGPNGKISTSGNSSIGSLVWVNGGNRGIQPGWSTNNINISIPDVQLPIVTFQSLTQTSGKVNGTNYTYLITSGNYESASNLKLTSSQNICINGNVVLYFPAGFQMSGQAFIYIAPGAKLTVYLGGSAAISGGGVINGSGFATTCDFLGLPACTSIQNSGSSDFIGTIYAPEATFSMTGGGSSSINFVGAVVASSISISGHYQFHFDESLCNNCNAPVIATSLANQTLCPGGTAAFVVNATGTDLTYQWSHNGSVVGSSSSLTVSNVGASDVGIYNVIVNGMCGSVTNTATLTLNTPANASGPVDAVKNPGDSITFSTTASGTGPFTYEWSKDGSVLAGRTSNSITLNSLTSADAGVYSVTVFGACNSITNSATLSINTPTTATLSFSSLSLCPGNNGVLSTIVSGTGPFTYVWSKNGVILTGQTTNNLTLPAVTAADAGVYTVVVTGAANSVTNSATVTINVATAASALTPVVVCPGNSATFSTAASGTGPFNYVWMKDGAVLAGQTTNKLIVENAGPTDAGLYSVIVNGACNSAVSSAALTVNSVTAATPLTNVVKNPGDSVTFSTVASGTGPFTYEWSKDGVVLAGQTTNNLILNALTLTNAGTYSVAVFGACNSVTNSATLGVNTPTTATNPSGSLAVCPGDSASFNTVASGTGPFSYSWMKDGVSLTGETNNTIALVSITAADAGLYSVIVTGAANSVTNSATLTVNTPTTVSALMPAVLCPGGSVTFTASPSGTGRFSYVWMKNGVILTGQTSNTITISNAGPADAALYSVSVSGTCNTASSSALVTVNTPTTASGPASVVKNPGDSVTLSTTASGTGPFLYVWSKNGVALPGQTMNTLTLNSLSLGDAGLYSAAVFGACNNVTNSATLTVNTNTSATLISGNQTLCPGNSGTLSVMASGTGPFTFVWSLNGAVLAGQTNSDLNLNAVKPSDAGTYTIVVTGAANSVTNSATVTVNTNTTATALTSQVLCPGSAASFTTTASGTGPFSYVWRLNGVQLSGQTTNTLYISSVSSTNAGTYSVEIYGSCNSVTNAAVLTVSTNVTATPLTSLVLCPGSSTTFTTTASGTGPLTYVWRLNGVQLTGQITNSVTIPSVTTLNAGTYSVEVYGDCNSVTNIATLTVSTNVTATPLASQVSCPGSPATFATAASGSGPFSYVWRLNGAQLVGQTSGILNISSVSSTNAGTYSVEVYGGCNSVTNSATLTVSTNTTATALTSLVVCPGNPATFTTTASGTGSFTYIWRLNGVQLSGQTTHSLAIASVSSTDAGTYSVEVYGSCNSVTNIATLTVSTNTAATTLTSLVVCPGGPATFTTTASGTGPFAYVWRFNGNQLSGQTTGTLSIPSVASTNAGTYSIEVYGGCNNVTNSATLTVNTNVSATAMFSQVLCPGSPVTFSTTASGSGPFSYVWRLNGGLLGGQTTHSITIPSVSSIDAGTYSVEVYGSCNSVTNTATLTVNANTTATPLASLLKSAGSGAMFLTVASGTGPFMYVWRLNGGLLVGKTNGSLTISSVETTNIGTYTVEVYGSCNSVTNSATLTLAVPPTVTILSPTNGSTFIALANITILAEVTDLDSTVTNVEFFAATNAIGVTNTPAITTLFAPTNKLGQTTSGPPYFILWTNVTPGIYYLGARGTDALGAVGLSQIIKVNVLDQLPVTSTGPMQFNPQTDVFEQPVRVTNPTYYTYEGVRLLIGNLAPGVLVYNATGITNGIPYVQSILPIPPGGSVDFTIDYYVLSRVAPKPVFTVQLVGPLNAVNQVGPTQRINRGRLLANKNFLAEFNTVSNRVYYLQYSADLVHWQTAIPPITGTGNIIDWIDGGPPETAAPPSTQPKRFYRLILLP